jgi:predicted metal-dependent HD superfamily phosphohydrolase
LDYKELLEEIAEYAADVLKCQPICQFQYHNIQHTRSVVKNVEVLGKSLKLDENALVVLKIAAWFHDLGYVNSYSHHEDESILMAIAFLSERNVNPMVIESVDEGINATRVPQNTDSLIGEIIADADLFDLGTDRFFIQSKNLWAEWNKHLKPINELEFWTISYDFLKSHRYYTLYSLTHLESKKQENLKKVEMIIQELSRNKT